MADVVDAGNKTGGVNLWDATKPMVTPQDKAKEELKSALDQNGDGKVDKKELNEYLKIEKEKIASLSLPELEGVIARAQLSQLHDKDGKDGAKVFKDNFRLEIPPEDIIKIRQETIEKGGEVFLTKKAVEITNTIDRNGDGYASLDETKKSVKSLKVVISQFSDQAKQEILENIKIAQEKDPTGQKEADAYKEATGIEMGAVSALRIREAKREAASPSNPDHDKAKKGEEGNTNLESKATGNGGKATVPQDVAATEQKVTGDIGNLDPAVRDLVKNEGAIMQKAGGSMVEANSAQYQAGAAKKPQEASVAATH